MAGSSGLEFRRQPVVLTRRRFRLDKSVNGTGTMTMSPCHRFIPILAIQRMIPEAEGRTRCHGEIGQLLLMALDHDDRGPVPGLEWPGQLDPTIPANCDVIPVASARASGGLLDVRELAHPPAAFLRIAWVIDGGMCIRDQPPSSTSVVPVR